MSKIIKLIKEIPLIAVYWDGSFAQAGAIRDNKIFDGIKMSTGQGTLTYIGPDGEIENIPRNVWIVRDPQYGIGYFHETGDSLLENSYRKV